MGQHCAPGLDADPQVYRLPNCGVLLVSCHLMHGRLEGGLMYEQGYSLAVVLYSLANIRVPRIKDPPEAILNSSLVLRDYQTPIGLDAVVSLNGQNLFHFHGLVENSH
jgi:hypothetical protein